MKYISKITLSIGLLASLLVACKDDNGVDAGEGISLDKETISIGPDGGLESIAVTSGTEWISSASQPWVSVAPANGFGSVEGELAIDSTLSYKARTAQVRFRQKDNQEKILNITQFGYGKQIIPTENEITVKSSDNYDKRIFELTISTNVEFKVDENIVYEWGEEINPEENLPDSEKTGWITDIPKDKDLAVDLDRKDRPRTIKLRFRWGMNTAPYKRVATIKFVPKNAEDQLIDADGNPTGEVTVKVVQEAAIRITDDRRGDSIAVIMMSEKIQSMMSYDFTEKMENWEIVTLWEENDTLPNGADAPAGRVRSLYLYMFDLPNGETLPKEIKHLKYLETFDIRSNANRQIKDKLSLGEEICTLEHLRNLTVYSLGISKLPQNFIQLADYLEYLDLTNNNFKELTDITGVVNRNNFKKLKSLELSANRMDDTTSDLTGKDMNKLGLHIDLNNPTDKASFIELLKWEELENLGLSYMLIEGPLPSDQDMLNALDKDYYTEDDFYQEGNYEYEKLSKDTCGWLLNDTEIEYKYVSEGENGEQSFTVKQKGSELPRVLPRTRWFSINLNFITGNLPNWVLFHPYFYNWGPAGMIINQWERGKDSAGKPVGFGNINYEPDMKYYFGDNKSGEGSAYPLYFNKYVGGRKETENTPDTNE